MKNLWVQLFVFIGNLCYNLNNYDQNRYSLT